MIDIGMVCLLGLTSFDDFKSKQVRVLEIFLFGLLGIIINFFGKNISLPSIIGGVLVGVVLLGFSIISREKIGKGDALIIMVAGIYLGFFQTLKLLWIASIIGVIAGLLIIKKKNKGFGYEMPFVPCLLVGYLIMTAFSLLGGI